MRRNILGACLVLLFCAGWGGAATVDAILARLDRFNQKMKTFRSDIHQRKFIKILSEFDDPEIGELFMKKNPAGIMLKKVIGNPGHTILTVKGSSMVLYYPKKNQAVRRQLTEKETGFANFGVAMSSAEMKKNFDIRFIRSEAVDGHPCDLIQLNPKSARLKGYFEMLYLWLSSEDGTPLQQRIDEPGGDYTIIKFLNIKLNIDIKDAFFDVRLPRNVEFIS